MKWVRPLILFGIGGTIYVLIELIARGRSHWTMFFVGGLAFYLIGCINEHKKKRDSDAVADGSRSRDYNRSRTDFRDHSEHYIRMECMGLQYSPRKSAWTDLPTVHGAVVLSVSCGCLSG